MKDKVFKKIRKLNTAILLYTCLGSTVLLLTSIYFGQPSADIERDYANKITIINQSSLVLKEMQTYVDEVKNCNSNKFCNKIVIKRITEQLIKDIDRLIEIAGDESNIINLVGNSSYDLIRISLKKHLYTKNNNKIFAEIKKEQNNIYKTHTRLVKNSEVEFKKHRKERLITSYITAATTIVLYLITLLSLHLKSITIKEYSQDVSVVLKKTANIISTWDTDEFQRQLSDTSLNSMERSAYSKIISMLTELEHHRNQMDLYRSLYSMIGFEIRGIAHNIKGGLKVLIKNTDEQGLFLAREISTATETLEDLAENFNRLLSSGDDSGSPIIDINDMTGHLATALSRKTRDQGGEMECYIDPTMPPVVFGNQVGLFWVLLLNFSNAIQRDKNKSILLYAHCSSSKEIDSVSLFYDFIFIDDKEATLQDIMNKEWKNSDELKQAGSGASLKLLSGSSNYGLDWSTTEGMKRLRISLDVIPKEYANNEKPLEGKNILMCGQSTMQVEIIKETISHYGAKLEQAKNPNDIFKSIARAKEFDAFLITDTIPGVEISSFCKTLKSRLNKAEEATKLLVSVADTTMKENTLEYIDHIFYRPIDNTTLINKLNQTLEETGDKSLAIENKILIVEDDAIQQILLSQLLSEFGILTSTADTGEEAIEFLKNDIPDMIFMDCIMPGMGGIEATRAIRANEKQEGKEPVTIIGATALSGSKDKKECIDAGMDYVISKPYNDEEIYKIIKNYLAAKKIN